MFLKYHHALSDEKIFHNVIHGLSLLDFHGEPGQDTTAFHKADHTTRKQVNLLEGLALLLVSKEKTDVVATGLLLGNTSARIFWAKNDNTLPTAVERTYILEMIALFARGVHTEIILEHIVPHCQRKIVGRCKKVLASFADSMPPNRQPGQDRFEICVNHSDYAVLQSKLQREGWIGSSSHLHNIIRSLMNRLAEVTFTTSPPLLPFLNLAYALTNVQPTIVNLVSVNQWRRLQKLGDYKSCVKKVSKQVSRLPTQVRNNITDMQVLTSFKLGETQFGY